MEQFAVGPWGDSYANVCFLDIFKLIYFTNIRQIIILYQCLSISEYHREFFSSRVEMYSSERSTPMPITTYRRMAESKLIWNITSVVRKIKTLRRAKRLAFSLLLVAFISIGYFNSSSRITIYYNSYYRPLNVSQFVVFDASVQDGRRLVIRFSIWQP